MVMLRSPIDSRAGWEGGRNVLIGGDFSTNPWQRGFEFNEQGYGNDDGSYTADRWMLLSEGDRIVDVVRGADGEFTAVTRTPNRRFGVAQIIEAGNARALIGHRCSLSARVMGPRRAQFALALLGWAAAADHLSPPLVEAWPPRRGEPIWGQGWRRLSDIAVIELGPAYGDALIADIAIEAAPITDMAVALWLARPTSTAGDTIHITDVQLEPGGRASPFERQTAGLVRLLCDRYYQRYAFHGLQRCVTTVIGTADTDSAIGPFRYRNAMRSPPRFVTSGTSWSAFDGQVDLTGCDLRARAPGPDGCEFHVVRPSAFASGRAYNLMAAGGDAWFEFDAEL